jgi:hypothetical protein
MGVYISPTAFALAAFVGMILVLELGRRVGLRRRAAEGDDRKVGLNTLKAAIFGLTSLILGFSFAGAMGRYDARRALILAEANTIGTAYLRIDLLPDEAQPALRDLFRRYVDSRLTAYRLLPDIAAALAEVERSKAIQASIWDSSVAASRQASPGTPTMLVLSSLNEMFDIVTTRTVAAMSHPPLIIFAMIFMLVMASAFIAGQDMASPVSRVWLHHLSYAIVLAATIFVVLEIEFPRMGLITLEAYDQLLVDVRNGMRD